MTFSGIRSPPQKGAMDKGGVLAAERLAVFLEMRRRQIASRTDHPSQRVRLDYAELSRTHVTQRLSMTGNRFAQVLNGVEP